MRVVHLSISRYGGAGTAAKRAVQALCKHGVEAELWTADGDAFTRSVRGARWSGWRGKWAALPLRLYRRRRLFSEWSNANLPSRLAPLIARAKPDLVHLHWVGGGFLSLAELPRMRVPVVWTLHDAWPFTGGCHYPADCRRFGQACGCCPQLGSTRLEDLSARNLREKKKAIAAIDHWIAPSEWMRDLAVAGSGVPPARIDVIPNGFDGEVFKPGDRISARHRLGLPADAMVLAGGAMNLGETRKGAAFLAEAVRLLQQEVSRSCLLLLFGHGAEGAHEGRQDIRALGSIGDEAGLATVYQAADVLLLPSLQDNLPNIAVEALACGCPTVAFDSGGVRDIVEPGLTGAFAAEKSASALAAATVGWLRGGGQSLEVAQRCRSRFLERFSAEAHARKLSLVYERVLRARSVHAQAI